MAVEIVATIGGETANSFITSEEMTQYCDGRIGATAFWNEEDEELTSALVEATRDITVLKFRGTRVSDLQALAWPRNGAVNPDGGSDFLPTLIPQRVKDATAELALQYLKAGETDLALADGNRGVIEKTVGPLTTRWESSQTRALGMARFPRIQHLLAPLLLPSTGGIRLVRV